MKARQQAWHGGMVCAACSNPRANTFWTCRSRNNASNCIQYGPTGPDAVPATANTVHGRESIAHKGHYVLQSYIPWGYSMKHVAHGQHLLSPPQGGVYPMQFARSG